MAGLVLIRVVDSATVQQIVGSEHSRHQEPMTP